MVFPHFESFRSFLCRPDITRPLLLLVTIERAALCSHFLQTELNAEQLQIFKDCVRWDQF